MRLPADLEPLIGPEQIAEVLGLLDEHGKPRVAAVYELSRARVRDPLPTLKIGKYVRARPSELLLWMERQRTRKGAAR